MKIFAYQFKTDTSPEVIEERFETIQELGLVSRNKQISKEWYRAESIDKIKDKYWMLDFVKIRMDHGPGRGGLDSEVKGFNLGKNEGFCEETAILFIPSSKTLLAQYNHYGPRIGAITEYLALFDMEDPWSAKVEPFLDQTIKEKLASKKIFTKFQMTFSKGAFTTSEYNANKSLKSAVESAAHMGGNKIHFEVSATGRDNTLASNAKETAQLILNKMSGTEEVPIDSAKISGKDSYDDKLVILDLVAHRVNIEDEISAGTDKRYSKVDRWASLQRAYARWRSEKVIK